jgi:hypothetical protein
MKCELFSWVGSKTWCDSILSINAKTKSIISIVPEKNAYEFWVIEENSVLNIK